jgi:hypothetical protein
VAHSGGSDGARVFAGGVRLSAERAAGGPLACHFADPRSWSAGSRIVDHGSGASVNLAGNDKNDPRLGSNTLTDAMGRYLLCPAIPGTGTDTYAMIRVQRDGYQPALRAAFLGWDYDGIDVELVPK